MNSISTLSRHLFIGLLFSLLTGCFESNGSKVNLVFDGKVTKVHDGDSVHITPRGKKRIVVRLAAIDAPEIKQDYGIVSRDHLRSMIMNEQVSAQCNKVDKYNRQICVVLKDNQDINLEMLKTGNAWYYERFRKEQKRSDQRAYSKAAKNARKKKLGIWANNEAIPPWNFRSLARN